MVGSLSTPGVKRPSSSVSTNVRENEADALAPSPSWPRMIFGLSLPPVASHVTQRRPIGDPETDRRPGDRKPFGLKSKTVRMKTPNAGNTGLPQVGLIFDRRFFFCEHTHTHRTSQGTMGLGEAHCEQSNGPTMPMVPVVLLKCHRGSANKNCWSSLRYDLKG